MNKVTNKIIEILKLIPETGVLKIPDERHASLITHDGQKLLDISPTGIAIPGVSTDDKLFRHPSPLSDSCVQNDQVKNLFDYLASNNLFQRLNHLGVCYQVESIEKEKKALSDEIKKSGWHLYEESSNDGSAWLFVGDKTQWQDPLVELVLVERTEDKWKDYWLPHFQIDIDTYLDGDEIEKLIIESFQGKVKPFRIIETKKFIVLVRARLGVISGINVNLDMGFEGRMTRYHRTKLLTQLA